MTNFPVRIHFEKYRHEVIAFVNFRWANLVYRSHYILWQNKVCGLNDTIKWGTSEMQQDQYKNDHLHINYH